MSRKKPTRPPHPFAADPDTPGDPISGDGVCRTCHLVGKPGDAHHDMPAPVPDAASAAAGGDRDP